MSPVNAPRNTPAVLLPLLSHSGPAHRVPFPPRTQHTHIATTRARLPSLPSARAAHVTLCAASRLI
eukprot:2557955-Prymnesium_polylepis.1